MTDCHTRHKALLAPFRVALYHGDRMSLQKIMQDLFAGDVQAKWCFPLGTVTGPAALKASVFDPLFNAIPDLERRDYIVTAGHASGCDWVGCGGYYTGVFDADWLEIPATNRQVHMRFHEFYRFEEGKVVEVQAIWDIPSLMMQAGVWPMTPSLGLEWHVPGPATQDGLVAGPYDESKSRQSHDLVDAMLTSLGNSPKGAAAMQLDKYWHPKMNWYGPSGIGTGRHIAGFRKMHQIPFLNAMPDRTTPDDLDCYLFADGDYVAVTGWPNMRMTISAGGWLGIAPSNQQITLRSLDFWRCENGLIRENWVLVDLLDMYDQIGVDVFARMRELT